MKYFIINNYCAVVFLVFFVDVLGKFVDADAKDHVQSTLRHLSRIPRDDGIRDPHHYHTTSKQRHQCSKARSQKQGEGRLNADNVCSVSQKNMIKKSMRDLHCGPPVTKFIKLKSPGPNFVLVPDVAKVKRCEGYCQRSAQDCLPTEISEIKIPIYQLDKGSSSPVPTCVEFTVVQHEKCGCSCELQPHHCTNTQIYSSDRCACICENEKERQQCKELAESDVKRFWDDASCSCQCHPRECPNGLLWIHELCRCIRLEDIDNWNNENSIM